LKESGVVFMAVLGSGDGPLMVSCHFIGRCGRGLERTERAAGRYSAALP
jgi:hypothetical protein